MPADLLYPLLDGVNPTIGWQFRPETEGGPAFMIVRRGVLGMGTLRAVETFPLTEDGWTSAWQALLASNPAAAPRIAAAVKKRRTAGPRFPAEPGGHDGS